MIPYMNRIAHGVVERFGVTFFDRRPPTVYGGQKCDETAPFSAGGSFAIAAVCRDGILLAADSRGTIKDACGRTLAYYDGVQKVFPIREAALAYTGQETIQNLYFAALFRKFEQTANDDIPLNDLIPKFLEFTDSTLPREAGELVRSQKLIVAGYLDGTAAACYWSAAQTVGARFRCGLGLVSSGRTIIDDRKEKLRSMEAREVEALIREAIPRYAKDNNATDIGGPLYVRAILGHESLWLGDAPTPTEWTWLHDFVASYWAGEVQLHLLPGVTREDLEEVIRRGETWSRNATVNVEGFGQDHRNRGRTRH